MERLGRPSLDREAVRAIQYSASAPFKADAEEAPVAKQAITSIVNSAEECMASVLEGITDIVAKHSSVGVEALTPETRLDEINIQSLDLFEIVFEIEERFKINVPDAGTSASRLEFTTIGQIAEGVRSLLAKSTAA